MDIIENWNLLNERMKQENPELISSLFRIHMGAFDDLRKSGHLLKVNEKPVSKLAPIIQPQQRLELAGKIGRSLMEAQGDLFNKKFVIELADDFPNCIFIALAAIVENLEGSLNELYPDRKMSVVCEYDTIPGNGDPLGKILPLIEKCYSWVTVSTEVRQSTPPRAEAPRLIPKDKTTLIFVAHKVTKVDTMRTVFGGRLRRGEIQKGDVLNVVDGSGRVICHEGIVLSIYVKGNKVNKVEVGEYVDEMCLSVEIPSGDYSGLLLVDGDKMLASSAQANGNQNTSPMTNPVPDTQASGKKPSFWSRLFQK